METLNIDIDKERLFFVITGDLVAVLKNNRLIVSLKRLRFEQESGKILIPFNKETQVKTLQDIEEVLERFGFSDQLSQATVKEVESFEREQRTFKEFSDKARKIRNDKFNDDPILIEDFNNFQSLLKQKLIRGLYPLQLLSAFHMAFSQNACNFSVPGAGKTSIVYGAYVYLKNLPEKDPRHIDKLLIIGPLSSFAPWENEYESCFGKKVDVQRLSGDINIHRDRKVQHLYSGIPSEVTLISHGYVDNLKKEIIDFLKRNKTMVVVDEAHRVKNPDGVWGKSIVEIAKEARARVVLTGTPIPNGYEDLFNLFQFLYPYQYRDILNFHYDNLVDMTKNSHPDSERVKSFIDNISPYFIRIKKRDLKLPPIKEMIVEVDMDRRQREIYDFIETKYVKFFQQNSSATVKDILNKARLVRLRQAASNPALLQKPIEDNLNGDELGPKPFSNNSLPQEYQDDSEILAKICNYSSAEIPCKFVKIKEILFEIISKGQKAIVWSIFIQNAKELQVYLSSLSIKSEILIGEVDQPDRESIIKKFNDPSNHEFSVVIANPFAVAESISLHKGCHNAIYLERDYNCSNFLQSKDRIHRVGLDQNQETNYYYILSKDSIDGVIDRQLNIKIERMEKIIDEDIPLFTRIEDADETDLIKALLEEYAKRT
jgi:SNF2 family DNA or RNA helicase